MSDELLPCPFKKTKDAKSLPPNDFDFQCFIMFEDGRIALSDGGTVCADNGQIIGWMHLYEGADFMNTRPDSKPYKYSDVDEWAFSAEEISTTEAFNAARERKE